MDFWRQFEDQLLDGQFKLNKYSGQDGPCAVFWSELPGQDQCVAVKIARSASLQAQRLISGWKNAKPLKHANLIRVYATASADLDGLRIIYAVTELPDATLASVIRKRCLTEEEGRDVLINCAQALHFLHQKGLVHTLVRPESILAVDVATKLSSDYLSCAVERGKDLPAPDRYNAPEAGKSGYSPATDIWSLGVTLFEALKHPVPPGNTDRDLLSLPGRFPEILQRCLDPKPAGRWTARQIISFLENDSSATAAVGVKFEPTRVKKPLPESKSPMQPKRTAAPSPTASSTPEAAPSSPPSLPIKARLAIKNPVLLRYVFSAVVIVISLGLLARISGLPNRPSAGTAEQHAAGASSPVAGTPVQKDTPVTTDSREPDFARASPFGPRKESKPQQKSPSTLVPASQSDDRPRSIWRVVVLTYASAQNAQAKAEDLNAKFPQLNAQVLSLGDHPSHIVVVGGKMSREQAAKLRDKLLAEGFPTDTYIQNFPE